MPSGILLVGMTVMLALAPAACRPMTAVQQRRWDVGLGLGCAVLLLLAVAAGVYGLRNDPF